MKENEDILKNRLAVWLIWLMPIACTGLAGITIWTTIQFWLYCKEVNKSQEIKVPLCQRKNIIEMNKPENLTEDEKILLKDSNMIKVAKGVYLVDKTKN